MMIEDLMIVMRILRSTSQPLIYPKSCADHHPRGIYRYLIRAILVAILLKPHVSETARSIVFMYSLAPSVRIHAMECGQGERSSVYLAAMA